MIALSHEHLSITIIAGAATAACLCAGYAMWRLGLFSCLEVKEVIMGPYVVLYREVQGPYNKLAPEFDSLGKLLVDCGLVHTSERAKHPMLGVFLDNPRTQPAAKCRAAVAAILAEGADVVSAADVERRTKLIMALSVVKYGEVKVGHIPASRALSMRAPMPGGGLMGLGIMSAVMRGYPALTRALAARPEGDQKLVRGSIEVYYPGLETMSLAMPLIARPDILVPIPVPSKK